MITQTVQNLFEFIGFLHDKKDYLLGKQPLIDKLFKLDNERNSLNSNGNYKDKIEYTTSYFKTKSNQVVTKVLSRPVKVPSKEICFVCGEKYNFIDDRTNENNGNNEVESTTHSLEGFYPYFSENKWHDMLPIIFDTEVVIRPTYLLDDDISNSYIKECTKIMKI